MNNKDQRIIEGIKRLENSKEKYQAFTQDMLPRLMHKDASRFKVNQVRPTYGWTVLTHLIEALQRPVNKDKARYELIIFTDKEEYPVKCRTYKDACYLKRKLKKITRLAFTQEFSMRIEAA